MSIELKPCPFCGGEAEFGRGDYGDGHTGYWVECQVCGTIDPLPNLSWSMEEVAAAWNTRAERTCRIEWKKHSDWFRCDACGTSSHVERDDPCLGYASIEPFFCPNCGSKVVE